MNQLTCGIVNDLLPLYAEDMVSGETAAALDAHLAGCPACRGKLQEMKTPPPVSAGATEQETAPLRKFRHRLLLNLLGAPLWLPLLILICALVLTVVLTVGALLLCLWCIPLAFAAMSLGALVMTPVSFVMGLIGNGIFFLGCVPIGAALAVLTYFACKQLSIGTFRILKSLFHRKKGNRI